MTLARSLLRLGSDQQKAATALARVVGEHPCAFNRRSAASAVCEALDDRLPDDASSVLEAVLFEQLGTDDAGMFAAVAPTLGKTSPDQIFAKCRALLADTSSEIRMGVATALRKLEHPQARALLLDHPSHEPWLRSAAQIAAHLGPDVPASMRAEIAERALADDLPSLRRGAATLLRDLDPETARRIAETALADEPDPLLRKRLQEQMGRC